MPLGINKVVECKVNSTAAGQTVINILHYLVDIYSIGDTMLQFINQFRTEWRANVLPLLNPEYAVGTYDCRVIDRIVVPPGSPPNPPRLRYDDAIALNGDPALDIGGHAGAMQPTLNALGLRKVVQGRIWWGFTPPQFTSGKNLKGSIRLGPMNKDDTLTAGGGNSWEAAKVTAAETAMETIRIWNFGAGSTARVVVVSLQQDGQNWVHPTPGVGTQFVYSIVTAFTGNPFVTSQASRKQRVGGA